MRAIVTLLLAAAIAATAHADEDADFGVAPVVTLRLDELSAPTPREVPGAKTVRTAELRNWMRREPAAQPLVFFCQGPNCWLSYNAALRAVALGYRKVHWYRGGIEAWLAAGGKLAPLRIAWRKPAE